MSTDTKRTYQVTERVKIFFGKYWNHCKNYLELWERVQIHLYKGDCLANQQNRGLFLANLQTD